MKDEKVIAGYDSLFEAVRGIAGSIQSLNQQALREYTPVVEGSRSFVIPNEQEQVHEKTDLELVTWLVIHKPA
jgi:uncharacterized protein YoxC